MTVADGQGRAGGRIGELMRLLADDRQFSSIEIAETLWLALQIEPTVSIEPEEAIEVQDDDETELEDLPPPEAIEDAEIDAPPPAPEPPPKAKLATSPPVAGILPPQVLPVWVADPAMLSDPLSVIRAMKPLLQKVESGQGVLLDESATVDQIARTRLWLPVLAPERTPWFDVVLVVDRGSSMQIWQRLVADLVAIFRRYGAFRNLQVFDLAIAPDAPKSQDPVLLKSHPDRPGHRPSELIDQLGRRIVIILSDCTGAYWWDGLLLPMMQEWSKAMPAVVWQMLPEWMWARTALGRGNPVALGNGSPGVANQQLLVRLLKRDETEEAIAHRLPMPVVTSDVRDLANWSLMLAGDRREVAAGYLLPQQRGTIPKAKSIEEMARDRALQSYQGDDAEALEAAINAEIEAIAHRRVERFQDLASPHARRLVMLLAAAPVITLPVMRLIRDSMLYQATSPLPVAEVFLSGLLQRLPGQDEVDPNQVQYDFLPKVREALLQVLPEVETLEVINQVSAAVEKRWNQFSQQDFRAFLTNPTMEAPEGLEGVRSFASVTATILERLGGDYAAFAQQLRRGIEEEIEPEPDSEASSFPELKTLHFTTAQLVEDGFPPLQWEEFEIATIAVEPAETTLLPTVESFEFTTASIERNRGSRSGWEILRRPAIGQRFIERLGEELFLEMVQIPGGTFMMGSPEDEPEHRTNEGPQHEVSVPSFLMGRYPITQAQWRFVAGLPQQERELDADPSRFKGENRPVERVSWYEAEEFCKRLAAHTGRSYRLPSEAEWEYACRAGTDTPFYFGQTLTTELANYRGIFTYNGGPKGEYRQETTPVNHFEIANAFGLCDMHGNVFEWCQDDWHKNYEDAPDDGSAWLSSEKIKVRRGGSWYNNPRYCRSAYRNGSAPDYRYFNIGFRVVCVAPRTP